MVIKISDNKNNTSSCKWESKPGNWLWRHSYLYSLVAATLSMLFLSCLSTIPVTGGATNLKKGERDIYITGGLNGSFYVYWDNPGVVDRHNFLTIGSGFRYGIIDQINAGLLVWSSIFDAGVSPSFNFQLLNEEAKINIGFKGNVSTTLFDHEKTIDLWGMPELLFGYGEYVYGGFRYEYRWNYQWLETVTSMYHKDKVEFGSETKVTPLICGFAGVENKGKVFRWATPFIMVHYDLSAKIWQFTGGATCHFLVRDRSQ